MQEITKWKTLHTEKGLCKYYVELRLETEQSRYFIGFAVYCIYVICNKS